MGSERGSLLVQLMAALALVGALTATTVLVTAAHHDPEHRESSGQPGGANQPGDFTSDPDAEPQPSANGQGDGNANGRPCAGCVTWWHWAGSAASLSRRCGRSFAAPSSSPGLVGKPPRLEPRPTTSARRARGR